MKRGLWEVKEVCDITGLTPRHLHYFHHEGVVLPADFSNYSVEHSGYKLYDEVGVAKLQQIAMYYEVGLKRDEIRDLMRSPDYDTHRELDLLKTKLEEKRERIDRYLAAIEQLRAIGTKNGLQNLFAQISMKTLGENALKNARLAIIEQLVAKIEDQDALLFKETLDKNLSELALLGNEELETEKGRAVFKHIFQDASKHLGLLGYLAVLGVFMTVAGEGYMSQEVVTDFQVEISVKEGVAAVSYLKKDLDLLVDELVQIIVSRHEAIGKPFDKPEVRTFIAAIKVLMADHYGLKYDDEYRLLFEFIDVKPYKAGRGYLNYILNALKYHCEA